MATELVSSDYRVWWQAEDCETVIMGLTNAGILETLGGFNIDVEFTSGQPISVDVDVPLASDTYVYGIDIDLQQTAAYAGTWSTSGGLIGIRSDVHVDMQITDVYAGYFNVYVDPAATCTVNDAVGVLANVTLVGPFTQGAATSSIAALKGMISNTSTGSYDGQVYNVMLSYGSNVNYGDDTALIMGYTHADARCDYGFYLKNYSPYMVAGICLTEVAGASPAMGHGLLITADCTTAAIQLGVSGTPAGDFVWYGTTALYAVTFDIDGDTNGSVLFGADTKGLMVNLYGDVTGCGVFWDPSTDTNGTLSVGATGGSKGVDMWWYSAAASATMQWDQGTDDLLFAGAASVKVTGAAVIGLEISGATTSHAISISAAQAGSGLHIGDTWKLGFSDAAISIGGDATIAFGSVAGNVTVQRTDVSAQMGAIDQYVMGHYRNLTTSGAGPGTALQHGIWMGDYTGLTIAHDTTDAYAVRGRTALTGVLEGNQFIGVMGQFEVTEAATLEATGGGYAVYGSVTSSDSGTCNRNVAAGYFTMRPNTINLAGDQSCVVADMGGSGYADYGFAANVGNNNTAAAIRVQVTDSAVLPIGLLFTETAGHITKLIEFPNGAGIYYGTADPNGTLTAEDGSVYFRSGTGSVDTVCYTCSGTNVWNPLITT